MLLLGLLHTRANYLRKLFTWVWNALKAHIHSNI